MTVCYANVTNKTLMLSVIILDVVMLSVIMLCVVMLSVIILSVVMLSVIMLSVVMLCVVMLSVMAPLPELKIQRKKVLQNGRQVHHQPARSRDQLRCLQARILKIRQQIKVDEIHLTKNKNSQTQTLVGN